MYLLYQSSLFHPVKILPGLCDPVKGMAKQFKEIVEERIFRGAKKKKKKKGIMTDTFPGMAIFGGARNWMCCSVLTKLCKKNANVNYELLL